MLPYGRQTVSEADISAVADVLRSSWLTTGPVGPQFERAVGDVAGTRLPAVAVTSGTAALHVAYRAAQVEPGDVVVTTPLTFVSTASTASLLGATVKFADVCEDTGNIDPDAARAACDKRTKVLAAVDFAGHPCDAVRLREVAASFDALLLEDAAHSIGGSLNGEPVGSLADITTFSFFPTKHITTAEGGAIVTERADLAARAREFRSLGVNRDSDRFRERAAGEWWYEVSDLGLNYRLADVLAALGLSQLRQIAKFKARRQFIVDLYRQGLGDLEGLVLPGQREGVDPAWHLFPLRVRDGRRRALFDHLRSRGIGVQVNYIPVYWHPWYVDRGYRRGQCPVAERYYEQEISLPLYPSLSDEDVERVIADVRAFFSHGL